MTRTMVHTSTSLARKRDQMKAEIKPYAKMFDPLYEQLEDSILSRARKIEESDRLNLGIELLRTLRALNEDNGVGTLADLGSYPKSVLSMVTAFYSSTPLNVIATTQPISDRLGMVFFQQFIASVTRGNVTSGDLLMNPLAAATSYPNGYAADGALASNFMHDSAGGWTTVANQSMAGNGQQFVTPVDPRTVNIYGTTTVTVSSVDYTLVFGATRNGSGVKILVDPTTGAFTTSGMAGATRVFLFGTVNFSTGQITITQSTASKSGTVTNYYVDYDVISEGGTDVQGGKLVLVDKLVQSQDFVLKSEFGLFEKFQYAQRFGKSIEDDVAKALMTLMNQELMFQVLSILQSNIPVGNSVTWGLAQGNGIGYVEHLLAFRQKIYQLEATMLQGAGRSLNINSMAVGAQAAAIYQMMPDFRPISSDNEFGPHIFGTLNGITLVRVPAQNVLDQWTSLTVARGTQETDSPVVWCPWMPPMITDAQVMQNPIQRQVAALMSGAIASLVPALSGQIIIDPSSATYQ